MPYPEPTNLTNIEAFTGYLNTVTNNYFWGGMIFALWIIILLTFSYKYSKEGAFAIASFISLVLTIACRSMGLVDDGLVIIFGVLCVIGIIILWTKGRTYY